MFFVFGIFFSLKFDWRGDYVAGLWKIRCLFLSEDVGGFLRIMSFWIKKLLLLLRVFAVLVNKADHYLSQVKYSKGTLRKPHKKTNLIQNLNKHSHRKEENPPTIKEGPVAGKRIIKAVTSSVLITPTKRNKMRRRIEMRQLSPSAIKNIPKNQPFKPSRKQAIPSFRRRSLFFFSNFLWQNI